LVDILVEDGERRGKSKVNPPEAEVIVDEIDRIINDPHLATIGGSDARPRSIGVISLIDSEQAAFVQKRLMDHIGEAAMVHHRIIWATARPFRVTNVISCSCRWLRIVTASNRRRRCNTRSVLMLLCLASATGWFSCVP
jgi:hypothetical protein